MAARADQPVHGGAAGYSSDLNSCAYLTNNTNPLWERACSRKRCVIQNICWLTRRLREQARSHIGSVRSIDFRWFKHRRLSNTLRHSFRLRNLAPLPTATPESAGLCACGQVSIVWWSLNSSAIGFSDPNWIQAHSAPYVFADCLFAIDVMAAARGRPSGLPGSCSSRFANLRAAATIICLATSHGG